MQIKQIHTKTLSMVLFSHENIDISRILCIEHKILSDERLGVVVQVHRSDAKFSYTICAKHHTSSQLIICCGSQNDVTATQL